MSVNLLDLLQGFLGKDLIGQLSGVLGEYSPRKRKSL